MEKNDTKISIPAERIESKILLIKGTLSVFPKISWFVLQNRNLIT